MTGTRITRRMGWGLTLACLAALLGMAGSGQSAALAAAPDPELSLRQSESLAAIVTDLRAYIPMRMDEAGVPGLSVALIRDGEIVWSEGFGVASTITREPVTPETTFEVASISKAVAAYTALRLVQRGDVSLDRPVSTYLSKPWLPRTEADTLGAGRITLRHLLSHTSGLTNDVNPLSKTMMAAPGEAFSYSGVGFVYLQEVMEQATGQSLEALAKELVFGPLGMASGNYVNVGELRSDLAHGHCNLGGFLAPVLQAFGLVLAIATLAVVVTQRLRSGTWSISWQMAAAAYSLAVVVGIGIAELVAGAGARKWTLLTAAWLVGQGIALGIIGLIAYQSTRRVARLQKESTPRRVLIAGAVVAGAVALVWLSHQLTVPVPRGPAVPPNAAYSLRATANDLARFLIEISNPRLLDAGLSEEMQTAQVRVNADNSWGLGLAIQHSPQGNSLWHGGSNRDFTCHIVVYPDRGWGAVVLTNGEAGGPVARDVAQRALGGKARWSIARQP